MRLREAPRRGASRVGRDDRGALLFVQSLPQTPGGRLNGSGGVLAQLQGTRDAKLEVSDARRV